VFDNPAVWLALATFLVGVGGTVLAFKSDLRNLTTRFDNEVQTRNEQRDADNNTLDLRLNFIMDRIEDIANAMGIAKRITDVERKLLAFKQTDNSNG
jgi:archaellum component FlaC